MFAVSHFYSCVLIFEFRDGCRWEIRGVLANVSDVDWQVAK